MREEKERPNLFGPDVCVIKLPESRRAVEMNDETENFHSLFHVRGDLDRNQTLIQVKFWSILL